MSNSYSFTLSFRKSLVLSREADILTADCTLYSWSHCLLLGPHVCLDFVTLVLISPMKAWNYNGLNHRIWGHLLVVRNLIRSPLDLAPRSKFWNQTTRAGSPTFVSSVTVTYNYIHTLKNFIWSLLAAYVVCDLGIYCALSPVLYFIIQFMHITECIHWVLIWPDPFDMVEIWIYPN